LSKREIIKGKQKRLSNKLLSHANMLISSDKMSLFLKNVGPYIHQQALQPPR